MMAGPNGDARIAFNVSNAAGLPEKSTGNELRIDIVALTSFGVLVSNLA